MELFFKDIISCKRTQGELMKSHFIKPNIIIKFTEPVFGIIKPIISSSMHNHTHNHNQHNKTVMLYIDKEEYELKTPSTEIHFFSNNELSYVSYFQCSIIWYTINDINIFLSGYDGECDGESLYSLFPQSKALLLNDTIVSPGLLTLIKNNIIIKALLGDNDASASASMTEDNLPFLIELKLTIEAELHKINTIYIRDRRIK